MIYRTVKYDSDETKIPNYNYCNIILITQINYCLIYILKITLLNHELSEN